MGPQLACAIGVANNRIFVKTSSFTVSNLSSNISLGSIVPSNATWLEGYGTTRGDMGTPPTFTASGISSGSIVSVGSGFVRNLIVDGATLSTITAFNNGGANGSQVYRCIAKNSTIGFTGGTNLICSAETCPTGFTGAKNWGCISKGSTTVGFTGAGNSIECISSGCTTGFSTSTAGISFFNCTAYGGTTGFSLVNLQAMMYKCLSHSNTTGYSTTANSSVAIGCATYNDGTPTVFTGGVAGSYDLITLTADPCVNAAGGNFALNNTPGGGAALKQIVQAFPSLISTNTYPDVGAVQSPKPTISG